MKKIVIGILTSLVMLPSFAQHHHHHGYWRHGGGDRWYWMAPLIVGGAVVYEATRPHVVVQQPPVVVQNPPVIVQQNTNCSPWTETQNPDGTVTRTRTCTQ
jgi:hypothetical protein